MIQKWLGLVDYDKALQIQQDFADSVRSGDQSVLLGLEHPCVVTLGKRGDRNIDVAQNCPHPVIVIDRGGQATLHQPGQLVIYPIICLMKYQMDVREYVELLELATMSALRSFGIHANRGSQPGIYTEKGKIGFIGVRVDRGVTRHGVSINVGNNLFDFQYIRSCGALHAKLDRVIDHGVKTSTEKLFHIWCEQFLTIFHDLVDSRASIKSSLVSRETIKSSLGVVGSAFP